jgi:hypothetical protein
MPERGRVLDRYTGGLRLTVARPKLAGVEVRLVDNVFVFDCQNPQCKVPPKRWPFQTIAAELRTAWDKGQRRFVITQPLSSLASPLRFNSPRTLA